MQAPQIAITCADATCHGNAGNPGIFFANNATAAFNFAVARSVANSPGTSLFLQKPALNGVGHAGGLLWPSGHAGNIATTNWINNGRPPEPIALLRSLGAPTRVPQQRRAVTGDRLADSLLRRR
jgi:hypothetical protein